MSKIPGGAAADLFGGSPRESAEALAAGAVLLRGFASPVTPALLDCIADIQSVAPFRHMMTPGGRAMSVALTNCGAAGWVTDRRGYRYEALDPQSGLPWPVMPSMFSELARRAAETAGYPDFTPDACLMNCYDPGAQLTLHQDRDECDFTQPIVSVSLGLPAIFLFGGALRRDRARRIVLESGDVVVWGGPSRMNYHGVAPLAEGAHNVTGRRRFNLTFRRAL
jgi:DNA oxidative demethylase